jgi:hypothetical protein
MPPEPILIIIALSTDEGQDLAALCARLTGDALNPIARGLDGWQMKAIRWGILVERIADQLAAAGYPAVHLR